MLVEPVTLEGRTVRLEPMRIDHLPALAAVAMEPSIWEWTLTRIDTAGDLEEYVRTALADEKAGTALPFVTVERSSGTIVGSTRFGHIDPLNRKVEIGWTWINPKWQRTAINTEAKLLMLEHAFEVWGCIRVELITDVNNERSRNAIQRIGAREEGILRNHLITMSGRYRDSVIFSIIDTEWDGVKADLKARSQR